MSRLAAGGDIGDYTDRELYGCATKARNCGRHETSDISTASTATRCAGGDASFSPPPGRGWSRHAISRPGSRVGPASPDHQHGHADRGDEILRHAAEEALAQ